MDRSKCIVNYQCPKDWDELQKTDEVSVRFCGECKKEVHFCVDEEALELTAAEGLCIAVPIEEEGVLMGDIDYAAFSSGESQLSDPLGLLSEQDDVLQEDQATLFVSGADQLPPMPEK